MRAFDSGVRQPLGLRRQNAGGIAAVIDAMREDGGGAIVVDGVKRREAAQDDGCGAVERERMIAHARRGHECACGIVPQRTLRKPHQLLSEHRVRDSGCEPAGREKYRGAADVIAQESARASRDWFVGQPLAGPVRTCDDALHLVDGARNHFGGLERFRGDQACVQRGRAFINGSRRTPLGLQAPDQRQDRCRDPIVVRNRQRFDESGHVPGALARAALEQRPLEGGAQSRFECVTEIGAVGGTVPPQQKRQYDGIERRLLPRQLQHIIGETAQVLEQSANYNDAMFALRYVALLALVIWLGGMILLGSVVAPQTFSVLQAADAVSGRMLAGSLFGTILENFHYIEYICGLVMLVCLFAIKFIGPPPHGFIPRVVIVAVMLLISVAAGYPVAREIARVQSEVSGPINVLPDTDPRRVEFNRLHQASTVMMTVNMGLGLVLLFWYVKE